MTSPGERSLNLVAGCKPWNRRVYDEVIRHYPGEWDYVGSPAELSAFLDSNERLPERIFFLHWSWRVPDDVLERSECVCFHMTDVPFGRGGSPLQNLIVRGMDRTKLTALRMTDEIDAGPVYDKRDLGLHGTAEEILVRASYLSAEMIRPIVEKGLEPVPQTGEVVKFARRKPAESEVPDLPDLEALHDFIRMLDAEGYPPAFLRWRGFRFELRRSVLYDRRIVADVVITRDEGA